VLLAVFWGLAWLIERLPNGQAILGLLSIIIGIATGLVCQALA
jgi:hypothetical protein